MGTLTWRATPRTRRLLLLTHIAASGAWLGLDLVLAVLVAASLAGGDLLAGSALISAPLLTWPIVVAGLLSLGSGVLLGWGTKYGLVRYWWVAVKLVLNLVLLTLVLVLLRPGLAEVADSSRAALGSGAAPPGPGDMLFPPIVSTTAVMVAMALSVFKPWGRVR